MQSAYTQIKVRRPLWRFLDTIGKQTGFKKGTLIEKAVIYFVRENRAALVTLGLDPEEIDRAIETLIPVGFEFSELQEVA